MFLQLVLEIQSDEKGNKSEKTLQIINRVVAESYASKCSMHKRKQFVSQATL
jgi:hypothetical protein